MNKLSPKLQPKNKENEDLRGKKGGNETNIQPKNKENKLLREKREMRPKYGQKK